MLYAINRYVAAKHPCTARHPSLLAFWYCGALRICSGRTCITVSFSLHTVRCAVAV